MEEILKIPSPYICPNCGETNYSYMPENGRTKGIGMYEVREERFFDLKVYTKFYCNTCGHEWKA